MNWNIADPLPEDCRTCSRQSCYNCDTAGKRWYLSRKEELLLHRKLLLQAIARTQKQIAEIDTELALMEEML